jgi:lipopolysaccharide export system permease protein
MPGIKTLDIYIGRRFFTAILGVFLLCSVLIFMIDFIELLRQSGKKGGGSIGALALMAILRLPAYTEFLLGFAVLVGSIFALLMLARRSELAVMRSAGMSVWVFLRSGLFVAFALGVFFVVVFNPMASQARDKAEELYADVFGKDAGLLRRKSSGIWLRQDGADGQSVLSAGHVSRKGQRLMRITAFVFDREGQFSERIDAAEAVLKEGFWQLKNAFVVRPDKEPSVHKTYLISTYLTPERVNDALGSAISISFWDLPRMIKAAEIAKISSSRLRIQYELLLSRPLLCLAMVLLAATVSLRSFRSGGIQTMVVAGMVGGLGFFLLAEVSRQIGMAGLASPRVAVWMPVLVTILVSLTVLLHQEDG